MGSYYALSMLFVKIFSYEKTLDYKIVIHLYRTGNIRAERLS